MDPLASTPLPDSLLDIENMTSDEWRTLITNRLVQQKDMFIAMFKKKIIDDVNKCMTAAQLSTTVKCLQEKIVKKINENQFELEYQVFSDGIVGATFEYVCQLIIKNSLENIKRTQNALNSFSSTPNTNECALQPSYNVGVHLQGPSYLTQIQCLSDSSNNTNDYKKVIQPIVLNTQNGIDSFNTETKNCGHYMANKINTTLENSKNLQQQKDLSTPKELNISRKVHIDDNNIHTYSSKTVEEIEDLENTQALLTLADDVSKQNTNFRFSDGFEDGKDTNLDNIDIVVDKTHKEQNKDTNSCVIISHLTEIDRSLNILENLVRMDNYKFDVQKSIVSNQKHIKPKDVVLRTQPSIVKPKVIEAAVVETNVSETKVIETEVIEREVKETKVKDTEVKDTEVIETEVKETEVIETEVIETEVKETEVIETEVKETKVLETEVKETEVNETEVNETAITEPKVIRPEELEGVTKIISQKTILERNEKKHSKESSKKESKKNKKHKSLEEKKTSQKNKNKKRHDTKKSKSFKHQNSKDKYRKLKDHVDLKKIFLNNSCNLTKDIITPNNSLPHNDSPISNSNYQCNSESLITKNAKVINTIDSLDCQLPLVFNDLKDGLSGNEFKKPKIKVKFPSTNNKQCNSTLNTCRVTSIETTKSSVEKNTEYLKNKVPIPSFSNLKKNVNYKEIYEMDRKSLFSPDIILRSIPTKNLTTDLNVFPKKPSNTLGNNSKASCSKSDLNIQCSTNIKKDNHQSHIQGKVTNKKSKIHWDKKPKLNGASSSASKELSCHSGSVHSKFKRLKIDRKYDVKSKVINNETKTQKTGILETESNTLHSNTESKTKNIKRNNESSDLIQRLLRKHGLHNSKQVCIILERGEDFSQSAFWIIQMKINQ